VVFLDAVEVAHLFGRAFLVVLDARGTKGLVGGEDRL
jgi:hypothetical protein